MSTTLFKYKALALEAYIEGFYTKDALTNKKCAHATCGYVYQRPCKTWCYCNQAPCNCKFYTKHLPQPIVGQYNASHSQCARDWCLENHDARPVNVEVKMECSRSKWRLMSEADLSIPGVQPDATCVRLVVANPNANLTNIGYSLHIMYDLINDKLVSDSWYQKFSNIISEHVQNAKWPKPTDVDNLKDVVSQLKSML